MNVVAQNNRFGTVAKIKGKRMEFATEDEAAEYAKEHKKHEEYSFQDILEQKMKEAICS